jgi:DNA-binding NarL/FixJ family response regulator
MANELTILIADHPVFRQGLRMVIERERSLTVLDEAGDGRAALEKIIALKPQIAVVDIHMPEMSGFDLAREIFSKIARDVDARCASHFQSLF